MNPNMYAPAPLKVNMYAERKDSGGLMRTAGGTHAPNSISVAFTNVMEDIPVVIVFRALGFVRDRDVLEHICYDLNDSEMVELFRPSLTLAQDIDTQDVRGPPSTPRARCRSRAVPPPSLSRPLPCRKP